MVFIHFTLSRPELTGTSEETTFTVRVLIDSLGGCAGRGSEGDCVGDVNSVTDREKSVETLDKTGVAMKKTRNALHDCWGVDATTR